MLGEWVPTACDLPHLGHLLAFVLSAFSYSNGMDIFFIIPFINRLFRHGFIERRQEGQMVAFVYPSILRAHLYALL